ncbi:unnamed protein product [Brassica napus]|uniref:(rape) hypothetical protein n=1 Tax=Brassica napus TaxID=3708 RepID=A0A816IZS3_BRANA|nr:unnamed protein product [Brassica napus]
MLLIDEQPTVMQGSVSASHIPRLRNRFKRCCLHAQLFRCNLMQISIWNISKYLFRKN